jgi:PTH1 family peptidyl-tRNA hydrolase
MKQCFGNADFWRLRIGLGRPDSRLPGEGGREGSGEGIVDWVLSDFFFFFKEALAPVFEAGASLLIQAMNVDPQTLLPEWAKKKINIAAKEENNDSR